MELEGISTEDLSVEIPSNSIKYAKIWFIDIQVLEFLMVRNYNFPQNSINICFHITPIHDRSLSCLCTGTVKKCRVTLVLVKWHT
jgi:hypothetical protein